MVKKVLKGVPNTILREQRERLYLTQADLAEKIGVTEMTIGRWERGEASPAPYALKKLCTFFQTSPQALGLERKSEQSSLSSENDTYTIYDPVDETSPSQAQYEQQYDLKMSMENQFANKITDKNTAIIAVDTEKIVSANASLSTPAPQRHRRWLPILLLVSLIIALGGTVAYLLLAAPTAAQTTSPQKTLETFCHALVEKDFDTAYNQFSKRLQQSVPESEIMKAYNACTTAPSNVSPAHPQCTLNMTTKSNKKYWRRITLALDEQHIWKIDSWGVSHKG